MNSVAYFVLVLLVSGSGRSPEVVPEKYYTIEACRKAGLAAARNQITYEGKGIEDSYPMISSSTCIPVYWR